MRLKTYTYVANISKKTHQQLDEFLCHLTDLYNSALQERQSAYEKGIKISLFDQQKGLTEYRKEDNRYLAIAQQSILRRVDTSYKRFFKKISGYPKYKSKRNGIKSFLIPGSQLREYGFNYIKIKDIGKFKLKKSIPKGKIKQLIIKKTAKNIKLFFLMEREDKKKIQKEPIGIDVGILNRFTLSNGTQIEKRELKRKELKRKQRYLSSKKKGSKLREKARISLQKEWQRTTEREHNYLHELTSDLVNNVSNRFFVEDLNINGMMKNHKLARSIAEQQWAKFIKLLTYKCEWSGGYVMKVNPKNTSKICSSCGNIQKIDLSIRTYECDKCSYVEDRDINAAKNILNRGIEEFSGGNKENNEIVFSRRTTKRELV